MSEHVIERTNAGFGVMRPSADSPRKTTVRSPMPNGPIFRSPDDIAEAIATQKETRVDAIIRRESELGVYELEAVRELGRWTI